VNQGSGEARAQGSQLPLLAPSVVNPDDFYGWILAPSNTMTFRSLPIRILHKIVANPSVYNLVQSLSGIQETKKRLELVLRSTRGLLLDVGAGTGNYVGLLPPSTRYLWLDNDREKLAGFRRAYPGEAAVLGDASRIPFKEQSVDYAMSVAMSHHLSDAELDSFLRTLARICRRGLIFMDILDQPDSLISRILWRYDRGSHPRGPKSLRTVLQRYFEIESEEYYRVYHACMICLAAPKAQSKTT
jgi:SAM-dependent methyltransferase